MNRRYRLDRGIFNYAHMPTEHKERNATEKKLDLNIETGIIAAKDEIERLFAVERVFYCSRKKCLL